MAKENLSFLVVDDEKTIVELLCTYLEQNFENCVLSTASNGKEAFDLCQNMKFDLILTDHKMPVLSGSEFFQKLRDNSAQNKNTPVLFISTFIDQVKEKIGDEGPEGVNFVSKPFKADKIYEAMTSILNLS
jgi:CheY-like chemotaxis protein